MSELDQFISNTGEQAIRHFTFHQLTLTLDTDALMRGRIEQEVEALDGWDHCDPRLPGHVDCDPSEPCSDMDDWPTDGAVGAMVERIVNEWLDESITEPGLRGLVGSLLDFGDSRMIMMLGEYYTPDHVPTIRRKLAEWQREADASKV